MKPSYTVDGWQVDPQKNLLTKAGTSKKLRSGHMKVLVCLLERPGHPVSKRRLLERGWKSSQVSEDNLSVAISHLRQALGDDPEKPALIKAGGPKNYVLKAKVTGSRRPKSKKKPTKSRSVPNKLVLAIILVLSVGAKFVFWPEERPEAPSQPVNIKSLAILPFKNANESEEMEQFAHGTTETVFRRMAQFPDLKVLSLNSTIPFRTSTLSLGEIAAELGVDGVLEGGILVQEDLLKIRALFYSVSENQTLETIVQAPVESLQGLHRQLFDGIVDLVAPESDPKLRLSQKPLVPDEAYMAMNRASYLLQMKGAESYRQALDIFESLIATYPDYSRPYFGLAQMKAELLQGDPIAIRKVLPEVKNLLFEAIKREPDLAAAYITLGSQEFLHDWDFSNAEKHLNRALHLAPSDPNTHYWLSLFNLAFGRFDETRDHLEMVRQLDPRKYSKAYSAWIFNMIGEFDTSLKELQKLSEENPDSLHIQTAYLQVYENMGREREAFSRYLTIFRALGYSEEALNQAINAYNEDQLTGLNRWLAFEKFEQRDVGQFEPPLAHARYCAAANEKDLAFQWLEQALRAKQIELLWLNVDPKYDGLRSDPRFKKILDSMGLDYR